MALRRVSQKSLAEALGISQVAVARRLKGKPEFSVSELLAAARFLDVPPAVLLHDTEPPALAAVQGAAASAGSTTHRASA